MPTVYKGYTLPEYKDTDWSEIVLTLFRDTIDTIYETDQHRLEYNELFNQTLVNIQSTNLKDLIAEIDAHIGEFDTLRDAFYGAFNNSFTNLTATNFEELLIELDSLILPNMTLFKDYTVVDVYENVEGTLIYAGYQDPNDNWMIKQVIITGSITEVRYATKIHAPLPPISTYTYTNAWINRETITYFDIVSLYNQ